MKHTPQGHDPGPHRTRSWTNLNQPNPDNAYAEQQALRALVKRNWKPGGGQSKILFYVLPSIILMATVAVAFKSFSGQSPQNTNDQTQLSQQADYLVAVGRYEEALIDYACLARLSDNNIKAGEGIALCYSKMGRNNEAIDKLDEIIARNPDSISAHMLRGECFSAMHEYDKARQDFSWLAKHEKSGISGYCAMADLLTAEGKREEALVYLDAAILSRPEKCQARQQKADILISLGRFAQAEEELKSIGRLPDRQENFSTLSSRSQVLMALRNFEDALSILDKLITLKPERVTPYAERARALIALKQFSKAEKDCDRILAMSPKNLTALTMRAQCHEALGDRLSAQEDFTTAVKLNPRSADAYLKLAAYQSRHCQYASALDTYKNLLSFAPQSKPALTGKQTAEARLRRLAGKAEVVNQAEPKQSFSELDKLNFSELLSCGYSSLKTGDNDRACYALKRAIKKQPNSIAARRYLTHALFANALPLAAEEQIRALKQLGHEQPSDNLRLAGLFIEAGMTEKALTILQEHLKDRRTDVDAIVMLSDALLASHHKEQALALCRKALTVAASPSDQLRLREKIIALTKAETIPAPGNNPPQSGTETPAESRGS